MRLKTFIATVTASSILIIGPDATGQSLEQRSGWYVGTGIGVNWASDMDQRGWNLETTCYPADACFDIDPVPEVSGYRWSYNIEATVGTKYELSIGRMFEHTRLALSFAQRTNDVNQIFRDITYYDGTPRVDRDSSVVTNSRASIDDLIGRSISLDAYYDFPNSYRGFSTYLGVGLGVMFIEVSGLQFAIEYQDSSGIHQDYDPPLSFYNSSQHVDVTDKVSTWQLHAGIDYRLNDRTMLGIKLTYIMTGDIEDTNHYLFHPFHEQDPDFTNQTTFSGARHWTLALEARHRFGK